MYYIYFITPEESSQFITFGRTESLGLRWKSYRTASPDPQLVGLIKCESKAEMRDLELQIKHYHLKNFHYRNEWLYHTPEVIAFYQERTNVDIETTLSDAIEHYLQRMREKAQKRRQHTEVKEHNKERLKEYQREYHSRPEVKERHRKYYRDYYHRKKYQRAKNNGQLILFD